MDLFRTWAVEITSRVEGASDFDGSFGSRNGFGGGEEKVECCCGSFCERNGLSWVPLYLPRYPYLLPTRRRRCPLLHTWKLARSELRRAGIVSKKGAQAASGKDELVLPGAGMKLSPEKL